MGKRKEKGRVNIRSEDTPCEAVELFLLPLRLRFVMGFVINAAATHECWPNKNCHKSKRTCGWNPNASRSGPMTCGGRGNEMSHFRATFWCSLNQVCWCGMTVKCRAFPHTHAPMRDLNWVFTKGAYKANPPHSLAMQTLPPRGTRSYHPPPQP